MLRPSSGCFLVMLCGLPGSGKSTAARWLGPRLDAIVVESDAVRRALIEHPVHGNAENAYVFAVIHRVVDSLLCRGHRVILDATNLVERHRRIVRAIALQRNAPMFVLRLTASNAIIRDRLRLRRSGEAQWDVYQRMRMSSEPISGAHTSLDTSGDTREALERFALLVERTVPQVAVAGERGGSP
ncbi:MAG: ATP-binding protein [Chloroflexi bacterium]|nr:ATP-binding protein [Chloroflexota bacterium]